MDYSLQKRLFEKEVEERMAALSVEHEKLSAIFRNIPDGVIFVSISGEIIEVNPMMEEIWGVKAGDIKGKMVDDLPEGPVRNSLVFECKGGECRRCWEVYDCVQKNCPAYMSEDVRCWLVSGTFCRKGVQSSVKRKRENICSECDFYKEMAASCGEVRELEILDRQYKISGALVLDKSKKVIGEIKTFYDVTEEKLLEKRKADFISLVTHDLKAPLANIMGYTDLILTESLEGVGREKVEYIRSIKKNSKRLLDMVEQYLELSRLEAGMSELKKEPFDITDVIEEAVADIGIQAHEKGITITQELAPGLPVIEADRGRMMRVMTNLLSNAVKYTHEGGAVRVHAAGIAGTEGGRIEITVSDNGYGIPEKDLPFIFDRYYRSSSGSPAIKGTGLGLAVVKSLVDAHGGRVTVESRPGEGSSFRISLPVGEDNGTERK